MISFRIISFIALVAINGDGISAQRIFATLIGCERFCNPPDNVCIPFNGGAFANYECVSDCGEPPSVANSVMDSSQGTTLESSASYTCDSGYEFAPMVSSVTCLRDGGWSDNEPNCVPIDCGAPAGILDGQVTFENTTLGSVATYTCDLGFTLSGTSERTCSTDGAWTNDVKSCVHLPCPTLTAPTNGSLSLSDFYNEGSVATFSCDVCYDVSGSSSLTCSNGTWNGSEPTCALRASGYEMAMGSSCYAFFPNTEENWDDALALCNNSGAHLTEINSAEEDCFILTSIQALSANDSFWWIGGTDAMVEGTFVWQSTGQPIGPYLNWRNGQPEDEPTEEDCMALIMVNYQWVDRPCGLTFAYTCELEWS